MVGFALMALAVAMAWNLIEPGNVMQLVVVLLCGAVVPCLFRRCLEL